VLTDGNKLTIPYFLKYTAITTMQVYAST